MIRPGNRPLVAQRFAPFLVAIDVRGVDWSAAVIAAQVRLKPDDAGAPLASFGVDIDVATVDGIPISTVTLTLAEATVSALPAAVEQGGDLALAWDMVVTADSFKFVLLKGSFTVAAGVTHG